MTDFLDELEVQEIKVKIMKALPFFTPFTNEELLSIIQTSTLVRYDPGEIIVHEGDEGRAFFIILQGRVTIQKMVAKTRIKKPILVLEKGQCFGEVAVVTGERRGADAVAEFKTSLLKIEADALNKETDSIHFKSIQLKFYQIFARILAKRLILTDDLLVKEMLY